MISITMNKNQIQTLKGFRDFLPAEKKNRDQVITQLRQSFEQFGFLPLETPTLEYASLLLGKYGQEADRLVYTFEDKGGRAVGLRYDQTVPSARVLSQYQHQLPKFFRRYQIQNVFRADKPQKGRFREFTQCDLDIFGAPAPIADAEILASSYFALQALGLSKLELRLNDRQSLSDTLRPFSTPTVNLNSILQSLDKFDKLPQAEVELELVEKGLSSDKTSDLFAQIDQMQPSANLAEIITCAENLGVPKSSLLFSPTLARGLDYYTGLIFEIWLPDYPIGSCGGGGRYDNLIQQLGGPALPAVGVGLGLDRLLEALATQQLNQSTWESDRLLLCPLEKESLPITLQLAQQLRSAKFKVEIYPQFDKVGKQLAYADQNHCAFALLFGTEERERGTVTLKNLVSGTQISLKQTDVVYYLSQQKEEIR